MCNVWLKSCCLKFRDVWKIKICDSTFQKQKNSFWWDHSAPNQPITPLPLPPQESTSSVHLSISLTWLNRWSEIKLSLKIWSIGFRKNAEISKDFPYVMDQIFDGVLQMLAFLLKNQFPIFNVKRWKEREWCEKGQISLWEFDKKLRNKSILKSIK